METIYSVWKISLCSSIHFLVKQTLQDSWESVVVNTKKRYDVSLDLENLVTKYETIRVREDFLRAMVTGDFYTITEEAKCPRLLRILSKSTFPEAITCRATEKEVASFLLACPQLMQKRSSLQILFSKLLVVKMSRLRMSEVYREMVRMTMSEFSFSRYAACPRPEVVSTNPSLALLFLLSVIDYEINFNGIL